MGVVNFVLVRLVLEMVLEIFHHVGNKCSFLGIFFSLGPDL